MNKMVVFDMDGTLADFYGVKGWLSDLEDENPRPYEQALPLIDMDMLNAMLSVLQDAGWKIVVTSWLAKNSTPAFDAKVRKAKLEWLARQNFHADEIHLVKYGTTKANCTRRHGGYQILFDDNAKIRKGWTLGKASDQTEIIKDLADLICEELEINC